MDMGLDSPHAMMGLKIIKKRVARSPGRQGMLYARE